MKWTCNAYAEMLIQRAEAKRAAEKVNPPPVEPALEAPPPAQEFTAEALLKILNE